MKFVQMNTYNRMNTMNYPQNRMNQMNAKNNQIELMARMTQFAKMNQ